MAGRHGVTRRAALKMAGGVAAALAAPTVASATQPVIFPRPLDFTPFAAALGAFHADRVAALDRIVLDATAPELGAAMASGAISAWQLCAYYLHRIKTHDVDRLRSVIELNPDALIIAARLDLERFAGRLRGPLHGVPVLLKDNIATGDQMRTTAGAAALAHDRAARDAFLVARLRDAGAIILGKSNLSEWANWMGAAMPNGFSVVGGRVISPYDAALDPSGSSTGSAVAVSANFAALAVGTETSGSIISPAARNGVVGVFPSLGLVSRDLVIPISSEVDGVGPIARTVTDAALMLTALAARADDADRYSTRALDLMGSDFAASLDAAALQGARLGLIGGVGSELRSAMAAIGLGPALDALLDAGATVEIVEPPAYAIDISAMLAATMRDDTARYFRGARASVRSIADVIAFNQNDPAVFAPYGQERLLYTAGSTLPADAARRLARDSRSASRDWLDAIFAGRGLDAIISASDALSHIYATAGNPAVTVPAGRFAQVELGPPIGLTFIGRRLHDPRLLAMAYAFEQAAKLRVAPVIG